MPRRASDRNLLFGILALQMEFISREALISAMHLWILEKQRPLGEILVERGWLEPDDRAVLEPMVARHVAKHGGDPAASLAALGSASSIASELGRSIRDPEMLDSIATVAPPSSVESVTTIDSRGPSRSPSPRSSDPSRPGGPVRYHKVRDHATGGLGIVYVARDAELNREVALKEIQDRHADDPSHQARFLLEAEVTGGLEHPGIVPVYGLGHYEDGRPFYAMRFIKGDSLMEAIERFHADHSLDADPGARLLALQKLLRRFLDVCNAIAYAHSRGVLHRDLKPQNVMVGRYGETLVVDWGLAKVGLANRDPRDHPVAEATLNPASASRSGETLPGTRVGTPAYMSPEQAAGRLEQIGKASDVYSLGATLHALLTGRAPYAGLELAEVYRRVEAGEVPRPRDISPWVAPALEAVCLKAMAHNPEDRYLGPRALADDLERWIADEPVTAWKEPISRRLRRWADRNRTLVTGAASLLLTAVVALGIATVVINDARLKESQAVEKQKEATAQAKAAESQARSAEGQARAAEIRASDEARKAREEAAKVVGVINLLVTTFRTSDPEGLEGVGFRGHTEGNKALSAREILERGVKLVKKSLADQPLARATLLDTIGDVYRSLGALDRAGALLNEAAEIRSRLLSWDDPDLSTSLIHLGWLSHDSSEFDAAEVHFRDAFNRRSRRFGPASPEALEAKLYLGLLCLFEFDLLRAEDTLRASLMGLEKAPGDHRRLIAINRLALAGTLLEKDQSAEAIIQSFRGILAVLDEEGAPQVVTAVNKFQQAFSLRSIGMNRQARRLFLECLDSLRVEFSDHPYLAFVYHEVGAVNEALGDLPAARESYRSGYELLRRTVGFRHPRTQLALSSYARSLFKTGQGNEAQALWEEVIKDRREWLGPDHTWVADSLVPYANLLVQRGRQAEARALLEEALTIYKKRRGRFPRNYASCLTYLAELRMLDGRLAEAEPLLRESVALTEKTFGPRSSHTAVSRSNLGRCLLEQGHVDEDLERLFLEILPILRSPLESDPATGLVTLSRLSRVEALRGKLEIAEAHAREALQASRTIFSRKPSEQAFLARELGAIRSARGDRESAIQLYREAVQLDRAMIPLNRMNLLISLSRLADGLREVGRPAEAEEPLRESLRLTPEAFPTNPRELGKASKNLAECLISQNRFREAEPLLQEAVRILRTPQDPEPKNGIVALSRLALVEFRLGRIDQAEAHAVEALSDARKVFASNPGEVAFFARELAGIWLAREQVSQAIALVEEAVQLELKATTKLPISLAQSLSFLSLARASAGDRKGSRNAVTFLRETCPPGNDATLLNETTWAQVRLPGLVADPAQLEPLAEKVLAARPDNNLHRLTAAVALLRAGKPEPADRGLAGIQDDRAGRLFLTDLYRAIAQLQMGRPSLARQSMARAERLLVTPPDFTRGSTLTHEAVLLKGEVEELFRAHPDPWPLEVFAP